MVGRRDHEPDIVPQMLQPMAWFAWQAWQYHGGYSERHHGSLASSMAHLALIVQKGTPLMHGVPDE